jgi:hypothetical protein
MKVVVDTIPFYSPTPSKITFAWPDTFYFFEGQ